MENNDSSQTQCQLFIKPKGFTVFFSESNYETAEHPEACCLPRTLATFYCDKGMRGKMLKDPILNYIGKVSAAKEDRIKIEFTNEDRITVLNVKNEEKYNSLQFQFGKPLNSPFAPTIFYTSLDLYYLRFLFNGDGVSELTSGRSYYLEDRLKIPVKILKLGNEITIYSSGSIDITCLFNEKYSSYKRESFRYDKLSDGTFAKPSMFIPVDKGIAELAVGLSLEDSYVSPNIIKGYQKYCDSFVNGVAKPIRYSFAGDVKAGKTLISLEYVEEVKLPVEQISISSFIFSYHLNNNDQAKNSDL